MGWYYKCSRVNQDSNQREEKLILEKKIEIKLKDRIKNMNGMALKLTSPGMAGVPDRLVLLPQGKMFFVELKAPGKTLRPLQLKRRDQLEKLGFKVYIIDSYEKIDLFLQDVMK